jgi:hypothetical protein
MKRLGERAHCVLAISPSLEEKPKIVGTGGVERSALGEQTKIGRGAVEVPSGDASDAAVLVRARVDHRL